VEDRMMVDRREARAERSSTTFSLVEGTFYRAVDPAHRALALAGSRSAGRFSPPGVPTLYLSSSREGVAAAMLAHVDARTADLEVLVFDVVASGIADLRDRPAMAELGIDVEAAAAPWQDDVAQGRAPLSWGVRDRLVQLGAHGVIDPSRKRPGLWHLTLFAWNGAAAPSVRAL
jgi:RES domain-containing protein